MDAVIRNFQPKPEPARPAYMARPAVDRPSEAEVEAAVRTLLRWTGDNPEREGLKDTPKRVMKAYREMFSGYDQCPAEELGRTFEEVAGYDDLVLGAWGCGAFGNDTARTAADFKAALVGEFAGAFEEVVFAIADWSAERRYLGPFREEMKTG